MRLRAVPLGSFLLIVALAGPVPAPAAVTTTPDATMTVASLSGLGTAGGLACARSGGCLVVGSDPFGNSAVQSVTAGRPGPVTDLPDASFTPLAIACPESGHCLLAGDELDPSSAVQVGALVPLDGTTAGPTEPVPATTALTAISCPTASACTALAQTPDGAGGTVAIDGAQAGPLTELTTPGFTPDAIACPGHGGCQLAGTLAGSTGTEGAVAPAGGPAAAAAGATALTGIGCPATGSCLAVGTAPGPADANGNPIGAPYLVTVSAGQPGTGSQPSAPAGSELTGIACAPGGGCVGIGDDPNGDTLIEAIPGGRPAGIQVIAADATIGPVALRSIACPSGTSCLATGQDADGNPVLATFTLPASAAGPPTGGPAGSTGSGASGSGASGSGASSGGASRGGSSPSASRHRGRPIATRLRLAVRWRKVPHPTEVTVVLREQTTAGGTGVAGARVRLELRPARPGARWQTVAAGRTGRAGDRRGVARLRLAITRGEHVVLRGIALPDGADAGARSRPTRLVVL